METKTCTISNIEKILKTFTAKIQNVKFVTVTEVSNINMKKKINDQTNEKYMMKNIEIT